MPSSLELRSIQKEKLFDLLQLQKLNKSINIVGLEEQILRAKAPMEAEDISHIEKQIAQIKI